MDGRPLIVQGDQTMLLEVDHEAYAAARDAIMPFSEMVKSPEHVHTYRITPLSLWNAAAAGHTSDAVLAALERFSRYPVPDNVRFSITDHMARYGRLKLVADQRGGLLLTSDDPDLLAQVARHRAVAPYVAGADSEGRLRVHTTSRGLIKQALIKAGQPVEDLAGYVHGAPLHLALLGHTRDDGEAFALRDYQLDARDAFWAGGQSVGGSGVICLPCGAGKTLVGLAVMERVRAQTLILCSSTTAARQWITELLRRTSLTADDVGEYTGQRKEILPVTVATYQILTSRAGKDGEMTHMRLMGERDWGLVIYDEVHLLPAPVFRMAADIQARRRLGLTATLVREDQREDDVFALIGPKRYDVPWRELEHKGWIASAECLELRLELPPELRHAYALLGAREQARLAAENPLKEELAAQLVASHDAEPTLVIGQYVDQLERLAARLGAPLVSGKTPQRERDRLFGAFRQGDVRLLVVSRVGNFAIDLPEASVAIEVSGLFGSRQEEAQRLGRILRPKADGRQARFYALVSRDTVEQEYAQRRQLFLVEQGYHYTIRVAEASAAAQAEAAVPGVERAADSNVVPFQRVRPGGGAT